MNEDTHTTANHLAGQIRCMLDALPAYARPTLVVVPFRIGAQERRSLIGLEGVAGCVLTEDHGDCGDERCAGEREGAGGRLVAGE